MSDLEKEKEKGSDGVAIRDRPVNPRQPLPIIWDRHAAELLENFNKKQQHQQQQHQHQHQHQQQAAKESKEAPKVRFPFSSSSRALLLWSKLPPSSLRRLSPWVAYNNFSKAFYLYILTRFLTCLVLLLPPPPPPPLSYLLLHPFLSSFLSCSPSFLIAFTSPLSDFLNIIFRQFINVSHCWWHVKKPPRGNCTPVSSTMRALPMNLCFASFPFLFDVILNEF